MTPTVVMSSLEDWFAEVSKSRGSGQVNRILRAEPQGRGEMDSPFVLVVTAWVRDYIVRVDVHCGNMLDQKTAAMQQTPQKRLENHMEEIRRFSASGPEEVRSGIWTARPEDADWEPNFLGRR